MLELPKSAEYNRRIPKGKFYENLPTTPALKRVFIDQIKAVYWRYKIAPSTTNLAPGKTATEIEVFEARLTTPRLDVAVLKRIDEAIPYPILFLLEYDGKYQAWIAYKEFSTLGSDSFKVGTYYHTDWMTEQELPLKLEGLDVDGVYENFTRQIAGDALHGKNAESLKESVERDDRRRELQKKIASLQAKVRSEKQLNKQVNLNAELKKLRKELERLL